MIGLHDYLVKVESTYENSAVVGGKEIMLTSIFEDAFQQFKYAKVIEKPIHNNGIKAIKDDFIFFSHLVFRDDFGPNGEKVPNEYLVDAIEKIYRIPTRMIYAYINEGEIKMTPPYVFVNPIKTEEVKSKSGLILLSDEKEIQQMGTITHIHPLMENFAVGDIVFFEKDSEYEVKVFGERYYRMKEEWLIAKYEQ